jgi:hypothetical protein
LLEINKKLLNNLDKNERLKPRLYISLCGLCVILFFYLISNLGEQREIELKNSTNTSVTGVIKAEDSSRFTTICSIELENGEKISLRCHEDYLPGEKVKLVKITKPSGYYYYEFEDELTAKLKSLTHHSNGTGLKPAP